MPGSLVYEHINFNIQLAIVNYLGIYSVIFNKSMYLFILKVKKNQDFFNEYSVNY